MAKSAPDGYTLLAPRAARSRSCRNLQKTPYEPLKDFAPVSLIALTPFALVAHPSIPGKRREGVRRAGASANPGKYTFASSGTGATAHLFAELFNAMAGLQARHVPYKGSAPALTDVINGQVTYTVETLAAIAGPHQVRAA